ncbi:MAG: hypothetical protein VXY90_09920, partial [Pseudomonadota bacterium]|nr:hypothetical protein [Pseudomonadota bacterium]
MDRLARLLDRARPALRGEQLALHLLALGVGVAAAAGAVVSAAPQAARASRDTDRRVVRMMSLLECCLKRPSDYRA